MASLYPPQRVKAFNYLLPHPFAMHFRIVVQWAMLQRVLAVFIGIWLAAGVIAPLPAARCESAQSATNLAASPPCCCGTGACKMKACPTNSGRSGKQSVSCAGCGLRHQSPGPAVSEGYVRLIPTLPPAAPWIPQSRMAAHRFCKYFLRISGNNPAPDPPPPTSV